MSWLHVGASVPGPRKKPVRQAEGCDDVCYSDTLPASSGDSILRIFVADGAGSVTFGELGAKTAIGAAIELSASVGDKDFECTEKFGKTLLDGIQRKIRQVAKKKGVLQSDLACTFQAVIAFHDKMLVIQVGDGASVALVNGEWKLIGSPVNGDSIDITEFVTADQIQSDKAVAVIHGVATRVASMTDGMTRFGIELATRKVHEPYFRSMFEPLTNPNISNGKDLEPSLIEYLSNEQLNDYSQDDRTLVLAVRVT